MRTWFLVIAITACSSGHTVQQDAPSGPLACKADLESQLDRTCYVTTDCVLVESTDCCGPVELAVRQGTQGSFPAAESAYVACLACQPMGCDHAPMTESGQTAGTGQTIVATCASGRCTSIVQ